MYLTEVKPMKPYGKFLFSIVSLVSFLGTTPIHVLAETCPTTSKDSKLYAVNVDGEPIELKKSSRGNFVLDGDSFKSGRKMRFFGKIRKIDPEDDFMIVIKIRGISETAKEDTKTVRLHRPSKGGRDKGFDSSNFPLERYSRHHFPDENGDTGDYELKYNFHTTYYVKNSRRVTDDSREKKRLFQFDGVGNKWKGGLFSRVFKSGIGDANADPVKKFVYLHAEIRNFKSSPCFEFRTYVPPLVDDLLIQVIPIDADQRNDLVPPGREWPFKKN
jgi:hypothetical protein